jgi:DnaJ-class molecular chaperone
VETGEENYTSEDGMPHKIRKLTLISQSKPTYDQFIAALKAGASFTCWLETEDVCQACKGTKVAKRTDGKSGKMKCEQCKGTGKLADKYACRLGW